MAPFASSASPDCYYRVLGVDRLASEADLTRAYRRLALKHHPDKNREDPQGAEEKFKRITEAYDVLRDPERRRAYDQLGKAGLEGCGGFPGRGAASRGGGVSSEEAERILRAVFGDSDFAGLFGAPGGGCKGPATFFFQPDCAGPGPPPGRGTGGFGGFGCSDGVGGNSPAAQYALQGGTEVVVHGLINAAERNGRRGKVLAWDQVRARYRVELEDGTSLLRAQNITQLCRIEVVGLVSKPELNGCCGRVLFYDDERGRYQVLLSSPSLALGLQPANCIFEQGTRVVLQGLSKVELNGTMARILEVDRAALRYTVECQGLRRFKVKLENVRC